MSFAPPLNTNLPSSIDNPTPTQSSASGKSGTPLSMTLLFSCIVVFSSLFAAFLLLCFVWRYRRALRRGIALEYDETIGTHRGVPNMWEVWTQGEPSGSQTDWGSIMPLSADVECVAPRVDPEPKRTSPASRSRRSLWNPFRRADLFPEMPRPHGDGRGGAAAPPSSLRTSFIIAMPCADPPKRRHSVLSQGPSVNGDWGNREFAIGIYHAPFREGSSL